ncbi:hypothetical protein K1T73_14190 [Roseovarius sp. SCSIO 43702]|nr:hypothetical protein K1T73_14190 [Roseovarius sp. SCSIO 43702]
MAEERACPTPFGVTLSEVFSASAMDAGAVGYVLSRLPRGDAPILWVQDRLSRKEAGRPYLTGIGVERPIIMVGLTRETDVLWAMEDGLRCRGLGAVIGEIWGNPAKVDFTATKRLAMRSEAAKVPCWLVRHAASPDLSAARDRWRIASLPSARHPHDARSPGAPRWSLDLFRSRGTKPGQWVASYDRTTDRLDLSAAFRDGEMAETYGAQGRRTTG